MHGLDPAARKCQIVLQLPVSESTDFDAMIDIEDGLTRLLETQRGVRVDRHDIGEGKFNVFILSDQPWQSILGRIRAYLEFRGVLADAVIATRPVDGEKYEVLWPSDYEHAFEL